MGTNGKTGKGGEVQVLELLAGRLQEYMRPAVDSDTVGKIVEEHLSKARMPRVIEMHQNGAIVGKSDGRTHAQFEQLAELVGEGHRNIMMVGPSGSGKTTLAESLAKAMDLDFGFISLSAGVSEVHLFGRTLPQKDGSWAYSPSRFVEIYENGGVFLLDELDAADANVMVSVNAALANGSLANPNGQVHKRHEKTLILAAANTWGRGSDHQYVGRNQLDASTLDRFILATLHVDYDRDLETDIAKSLLVAKEATALLSWVKDLREKIAKNKLRRVASTRLVVNGAAALKAGRSLDDLKKRFLQDWSTDERAKVEG
nr:hypothetical protein 7 [Flavobacteriaceae bacterium]